MNSQFFTQAIPAPRVVQQCRWDFCDRNFDSTAELVQHVKSHAQSAKGLRRSKYNQESFNTTSSDERNRNAVVPPASQIVDDPPSSSANQFPSAQIPQPASSPFILAPNSSGSGEPSLVLSTAPAVVPPPGIIAAQSQSLDEIQATPSSTGEVVVVPESLESDKSTTSGNSSETRNPLKDVHLSFGWGNRLPPKKSPPK